MAHVRNLVVGGVTMQTVIVGGVTMDKVVSGSTIMYLTIPNPTITYVSKTETSVTFTIKNNDIFTQTIYYEIDDGTPDAYSISLAAGATSSNLTLSGMTAGTAHTVYAQYTKDGYASDAVYYSFVTNIAITAPTITYVSKTATSITFTVKNNHSVTALIYYEHTDSTPDLAYVSLSAGATSSNLTISGLASSTYYYIYAQADVSGVKSTANSIYIQTNAAVQTATPTISNVTTIADGMGGYYIKWRTRNNDASSASVSAWVGSESPRARTAAAAGYTVYLTSLSSYTSGQYIYAYATVTGESQSNTASYYKSI